MKPILLLDESLEIEVFYSKEDCDLADNICVRVIEDCPEDEKIFKHEESHIFITRQQAMDLVAALTKAIEDSSEETN